MPATNTLVQRLALYTNPDSHNAHQYPIVTRPHTGGLGRDQVVNKPIKQLVELGRDRSGNFDDRHGRVDFIGNVNADSRICCFTNVGKLH